MKTALELIVSRPIAVFMAVLTVAVFGIVSYYRLPVHLMPKISYPTLTVRTEYPGSAPEEVEKNITKPIEEALSSISNLVSHNSISRSELSDVILEFTWNTNMSTVVQEIREKLDRIFLPKDSLRPLILRYDPSLDPIMRIGIYSKEKTTSLFKLRNVAEYTIKRSLETVKGVASIKVKGGLEEEIQIKLEEDKLSARGISISRVIERIREENLNLPCGSLREGKRIYLVRTRNEFKNIEEIRNLPITTQNQIGIPLRELGTIVHTHKEQEVITRVGGKLSVEIEVFKEADANIVAVADAIKKRLLGPKKSEDKKSAKKHKRFTWIAAQLPKDIRLEVLSDSSRFIEKAIWEVISTCITGGILAIIVLYVFLQHGKSTLVIGLTIPISIISIFAPLYLFGTSLNIMSLGGLALGVGMLVDNAIVVLESIVRCEDKNDRKRSVVEGTDDVAGAICASTFTTIAVFFPILYVEGIAGQIFKDQALTVVFALLASLIAALVVIPVLASQSLRQKGQKYSYLPMRTSEIWNKEKVAGLLFFLLIKVTILYLLEVAGKIVLGVFHLFLFFVKFLGKKLANIIVFLLSPIIKFTSLFKNSTHNYKKFLSLAISHPYLVASIASLLFVATIFSMQSYVGAELIPELHQGEFNLHVVLPVGYSLEKTNDIIKKFEQQLLKNPLIEKVFSKVGVEKTNTSSSEEGEHTGIITCLLNTKKVSPQQEDLFINNLRTSLQSFPQVKFVRFSRPSLFTFKTPIEIEIYGYQLKILKEIVGKVTKSLYNIEGLYDIKVSLAEGNPELQIIYNRKHLFQHNLKLSQVATVIKHKVQGEIAGKFRAGEREVPIRIQIDHITDKSPVQSLENLTVNEKHTKLSEIGKIKQGKGPSEIRHMGQERVVLIRANLYGFDLKTMVRKITKELENFSWPTGYHFHLGGQNQEQKIAIDNMQFALLLAAFLVYAIMASQFESLQQPLIIMFTLPLAFVGVIIALILFNIPISIIVLIGCVILSGIVVNNAIVMIDCINRLRKRGLLLKDAVLTGAQMRLRPILMTTLTTILGLLPMTGILPINSGEGIEIRSPLAVTVISGLISSTLLTLIVIPTVYTWLEKRKTHG